MNTLYGVTEIDTYYEYIGFRTAQIISENFHLNLIYVLIAIIGFLYLFYTSFQKGTFKEVLIYFIYLFVMWFLISPVKINAPDFVKLSESRITHVNVPRILYLMNKVLDQLIRSVNLGLTKDLARELEIDRASRILMELELTDTTLKNQVKYFLEACYAPAIARLSDSSSLEKFIDNPLSIRDSYQGNDWCFKFSFELEKQLNGFVINKSGIASSKDHFFSPETMRELARRYFGTSSIDNIFINLILKKEMLSIYGATSDFELAKVSTGGSSYSDKNNSYDTGIGVVDKALHVTTQAVANSLQYVNGQLSSHAQRYEAMQKAPYYYGFMLMLAISIFPLAACYSLLPSKWLALVNFFKLLISIKIWPLFWTMIYMFNSHIDDAQSKLIIPWIYIIIPTISFVLVSAVTSGALGAVKSLGVGNTDLLSHVTNVIKIAGTAKKG